MVHAAVALLILSAIPAAAANPLARDPQAIRDGKRHYESYCSGCHGIDGHGGRGPDLHFSQKTLSEEPGPLFDAIKNGIPGTEMVPLGISAEQAWQIVSFLQSLTHPGAQAPLPGNVIAGRKIFDAAGCRKCHMIDGRGGILGPDLSGIARTRKSGAIREAILKPGKTLLPGYHGARAIDRSGRVYSGVIKNQDNFTIQMLTTALELVSLDRSALKTFDIRKQSLMPADYGRSLNETQLRDLLAFLDRRRRPTLRYEKGFGNY